MLFLSFEIGKECILIKHTCLFVSFTAFAPAALIYAFAIEQNETKALLIIVFIDSFANLTQVHAKYLIARHLVLLLFSFGLKLD